MEAFFFLPKIRWRDILRNLWLGRLIIYFFKSIAMKKNNKQRFIVSSLICCTFLGLNYPVTLSSNSTVNKPKVAQSTVSQAGFSVPKVTLDQIKNVFQTGLPILFQADKEKNLQPTNQTAESENNNQPKIDFPTQQLKAKKNLIQAKIDNQRANTVPQPALYRVDAQNRKVCRDKDDYPLESNKNKGIHLDNECCLDPDEIPNANCFYPRSKYGKLLDRYNKKKEILSEKWMMVGRKLPLVSIPLVSFGWLSVGLKI